ncbi:hypothetical protein QTP86_012051, partial [Hemibagrus guttatus]
RRRRVSEDVLPVCQLPRGFLPVHVNGTCCKKCRPKCWYLGRALSEGQRVFLQSCKECKNGVMEPVNESCPNLNCTVTEQILPENRCCNVCRGHDFCAEGLLCGENSVCKNRNNKAECECKSGYTAIQGDSTYCEDGRCRWRGSDPDLHSKQIRPKRRDSSSFPDTDPKSISLTPQHSRSGPKVGSDVQLG